MKLISISLAWITGSILYALAFGYDLIMGINPILIWLGILIILIFIFRYYVKKLFQ